MKYILDTNTVSAFLKGNSLAVQRLRTEKRLSVAIPQPVISEISFGIARLPASKRKARLQKRWTLFEKELVRVNWNDEVSHHFGIIKASLERRGKVIEDFDIAIAAHAVAHEAILVTADKAHMARISGIKLEDWTR
ncbi:MAG: type II toxin-antitoxin system VapC family toxin [Deltaproteobacteria bacterium]|nr:type II toxin-antitoxin system VapC family toxin [Deltaproteobacteria bacterium]